MSLGSASTNYLNAHGYMHRANKVEEIFVFPLVQSYDIITVCLVVIYVLVYDNIPGPLYLCGVKFKDQNT